MRRSIFSIKTASAAALIALFFAMQAHAQQNVYFYRFENAKFDISFVEIKIYEDGRGDLRYKKRDEENDITIDMQLLPATVQRLAEFYDTVGFLGTDGSYQSDKQFPHLGAVTLGMRTGKKSRETGFNYTNNRTILQLVELYRAIENQQRKVFEMKLARQFTPLDLPRQLKSLEADLKSSRIAEPQQLMPFLSEIELDDSLPLIARNAAGKLLMQIKKKG